jgi:hypothetical protein
MSDEKKPFTVTDRRHFTSEGHARETADAPQAEAPPETEAPSPPSPNRAPQARPEDSAAGGPDEPDDDEGSDRPAFPADFASLLLSLAAQGSILLGLGGPQEAPAVDLEGARSVIGLLEVLRDKTEGRRTPEEDGLLDSILYELRMAYVARTRAGGA